MPDEPSTTRQSVKTYIPEYQKAEWAAHAADLEMSQSEFVRCMVQAGRRGFAPDRETPASKASTPRGNELKDRILARLTKDECDWDELMDSLIGNFEEDVEHALGELIESGSVDTDVRGTFSVSTA